MQGSNTQTIKKKLLIGAIVCAIAFLALLLISSLSEIGGWLRNILLLLRPILIGLVMAYLLNPFFRFFERKLFRRLRPFGLCRALSLFFTILLLFVFIFFVAWMILPGLIDSLIVFVKNYNQYMASAIHKINEIIQNINGFLANLTTNDSMIGYLDEQMLIQFLSAESGKWINSMSQLNYQPITGVLGSTFSGIWDFVIGLFITVYFLASKEKRYAQVIKLRHALFGNSANGLITRICTIADQSFGRFIKGKLIDSLIIAVLIYLPLLLFGVPYAPLIAIFIGITNIIPLVGIYIGMIPTALIVLIADTEKIIPFLIIVIIIQQIDSNIISPRILGSNTGVSSLCVLISITVVGALFGWIGMLIAVPLFATVLALLDEWTVARLHKKGLPSGIESYYANDSLAEPEQNVLFTIDKTAQKIERRALHAHKKEETGEKLTKRECFAMGIQRFAHKYHFFVEASEESRIAVFTENIAKKAMNEAQLYLQENTKDLPFQQPDDRLEDTDQNA